jgi:hypothetical protein
MEFCTIFAGEAELAGSADEKRGCDAGGCTVTTAIVVGLSQFDSNASKGKTVGF